MANTPSTFQYICTENFPKTLYKLKVGLAISTYQAGRVLFLSAPGPRRIIQIPKKFARPMGIAIEGHKMAIASMQKVEIFGNAKRLAKNYPNNPRLFDSLYLPRASYFSGYSDLHDLAWGTDGLWAVNTAFSCLALIDHDYSFKPMWQPHFITDLMPEDRCHLNGLAMKDGKPAYVSVLGKYDTREGWRETRANGGLLMDVEKNEIILDGLPMPHSPRMHEGRLFMLFSATGQLVEVDVENKSYKVLADLNGFTRGMSAYGDYLFIGLSKLRKTSKAKIFQELPISDESQHARVVIFQLSTNKVIAQLEYSNTAEELFEVHVVPNTRRLNLVGTHNEVHKRAIAAPDLYFWRKDKEPEEEEQQPEDAPTPEDTPTGN